MSKTPAGVGFRTVAGTAASAQYKTSPALHITIDGGQDGADAPVSIESIASLGPSPTSLNSN